MGNRSTRSVPGKRGNGEGSTQVRPSTDAHVVVMEKLFGAGGRP